jgi:predicted HicB family RNase H-like nuclease
MAKTQLGARVDDEVAELAKARAKDRGLSVGDYIAHLVREDVDGLRARGLDAARHFLDEHQALFDEAEDEEAGRGDTSGAHAA